MPNITSTISDLIRASGPHTYTELLAEVLDQATFEGSDSNDPVTAAQDELSYVLRVGPFSCEALKSAFDGSTKIYWSLEE